MKKFILFFLVACLCVSFSACGIIGDIIDRGGENENEISSANKNPLGILGGIGKDDKDDTEDKYADLIEMLENEDYENALLYIIALSQSGSDVGVSTEIILPGTQVEAELPYEVISTYENITDSLDSYADDGYFSFYDMVTEMSYSGNDAFARAYEFLGEYSDYEAAKEYLARFTFIEDVLLSVDEKSYDYLGNMSEYTDVEWYKYDTLGRPTLAYYSDIDLRYDSWYNLFSYEYGTDGYISFTRIYTWEDGDVDALIIPTYENGVLVSEEVRCADGDVFTVYYTYDEMGRLSYWLRTNNDGNSLYSTTYNYNAEGLLESEQYLTSNYDSWEDEYVHDTAYTKTYTYDANGRAVKMEYTKQESYDNYNCYYWRTTTDYYDFDYDEMGRLSSVIVVYGDSVYGYDGSTSLPSEINSEYSYDYGNYYFFE